MAVTRAEAEQLYTRALAQVRAVGLSASGDSRADVDEVSRALWQRFQGTGDIRYTDARNAVMRAMSARELGGRLTDHPQGAANALVRDYPFNPGIASNASRFEYRVVVRLTGQGYDFETLVVVGSGTRMEGQQVIERAERVAQNPLKLLAEYHTKLSNVGTQPTAQSWIVSASRRD